MNSLVEIDFKKLIAKETNARMRIRLLALAHIKDGANRTETAKFLKISRRSVNDWVRRFYSDGIEGIKDKPRSGRPCALSEKQQEQLKKYILDNSIKPDGGRLKAALLINYIHDEFGIKYSLDNIYRLLHSLNFSWITSRSRHPKQSLHVQEDFKKIPK